MSTWRRSLAAAAIWVCALGSGQPLAVAVAILSWQHRSKPEPIDKQSCHRNDCDEDDGLRTQVLKVDQRSPHTPLRQIAPPSQTTTGSRVCIEARKVEAGEPLPTANAAITRTATPFSFARQGASVVAFALTLFETDRRAGSIPLAGRLVSTGWQYAAEETLVRTPPYDRKARSLNQPLRRTDSCTVRPCRPPAVAPSGVADTRLSRRRFYGENKNGRHAVVL